MPTCILAHWTMNFNVYNAHATCSPKIREREIELEAARRKQINPSLARKMTPFLPWTMISTKRAAR